MHLLNTRRKLKLKLVLIDDDKDFCKIIASYALSRGINLDCFGSLEEMGTLSRFGNYSGAIVDYNLGPINGIEVAEYLPVFFGEMPMVLISGRFQRKGWRKWPASIKKFVHKDDGPDAILDAAISAVEEVDNDNIPKNLAPAASWSWRPA